MLQREERERANLEKMRLEEGLIFFYMYAILSDATSIIEEARRTGGINFNKSLIWLPR